MMRRYFPIVVGGCHRSGTTLVRRILNAHSHIFCGAEVKFFRDFYGHYNVDDIAHLRFSQTVRSIVDDSVLLREWGRMYVRLLRQATKREHKRRWADKNPENVLYLPQWESLLGKRWLYLHVVRNPLDVLASIDEVGFDLTIPRDWTGRIEHVRRYMELGMNYAETHPQRACVVVYEKLVANPKETLAEMMHFLGERSEQSQLDFSRQKHVSGIEDPKIEQTTTIHKSSVGRWRSSLPEEVINQAREATADLWQRIAP